MNQLELSLQQSHGLLDTQTPLDHRKVGRRRLYALAFDTAVYRVGEVVGQDLDLIEQSPRS